MKLRSLIILLGILLTGFLVGCQSNDVNEEVEVPVQENMELENENEEDDPNSPTATYVVEEADYETFLTDYENELVDDGWEVTLDAKPDFLTLKKGNKELKIMPVESDGEIKVHLYETVLEEEENE